MQRYQVSLDSQDDIVIMRVGNGWLIRTDRSESSFGVTPLRVAETPAALVEIVKGWAENQQAEGDLQKANPPIGEAIPHLSAN